ncbi:AAA family ATPase [Streptomyces venetus]|uniref:AAA family ATPase n=1 Tax=Streptomyces venetus TaxID=1701086 RepID=UPI003C2F92E5
MGSRLTTPRAPAARHPERACPRTGRCADGHRTPEERATTDPELIHAAWAHRPYNVGIAIGPAGLLVVDLDVPKPEEPKGRHGVYGVDFPRGVFPTLERPVLEDVAADLRAQLKAGHDVVVDHGFWTPEDRAKWRAIATDAGAAPVLVYLAASHDELWARISKRNEFHADDPNSIYFSESDLQRYRTRFVPPEADEPHLRYNGDPEAVTAALDTAQF